MGNKAFRLSDTSKEPSPGTPRVTPDAISPPPQPPKKRGRPPGHPKTGGRQKNTKNWTAPEIRDALLGRSNAIDVLADIVAGRPLLVGTERASSEAGPGSPVWRYPTLNQRLKGLEVLLAKVVPDLKAVEAVVDTTVREEREPHDARQLARAILFAWGTAPDDEREVVLRALGGTPRISAPEIDEEAVVSSQKKSQEGV